MDGVWAEVVGLRAVITLAACFQSEKIIKRNINRCQNGAGLYGDLNDSSHCCSAICTYFVCIIFVLFINHLLSLRTGIEHTRRGVPPPAVRVS